MPYVECQDIQFINTLRPGDGFMHHCFQQWLVAYSAPCHYLNQYRFIVNRTMRNIFQYISMRFVSKHENASAKGRPFCSGPNVSSIEMWLFGRYLCHWLHRKLPKRQLPLRQAMKIQLKMTTFSLQWRMYSECHISFLPRQLLQPR